MQKTDTHFRRRQDGRGRMGEGEKSIQRIKKKEREGKGVGQQGAVLYGTSGLSLSTTALAASGSEESRRQYMYPLRGV